MIDEFRRARRRKVSDTIMVIDAMTDSVVGRIGNISETGMLLIASFNTLDGHGLKLLQRAGITPAVISFELPHLIFGGFRKV